MLSPATVKILDHYQLRMVEEEKQMRDFKPDEIGAPKRDDLLLAVGEDAGYFLYHLAIGCQSRHILEIGTSYGYSTLFLASAAQKVGGKVTTIELSPKKQNYAKKMIARAGLEEYVDWHLGDALDIIEQQNTPFDLVFLDIWKELYVPCLDRFYPKLSQNSVIVADNIQWPTESRADAQKYREAVDQKGDLHSTLLPIGSGLLISSRL